MIAALSYLRREQKTEKVGEADILNQYSLKALERFLGQLTTFGITECYLLTDNYKDELNNFITIHSEMCSFPTEVIEITAGAGMWEEFISIISDKINKEKLLYIRGDIFIQSNVLEKFTARKFSSYIRTYAKENLKDIEIPTVFADFAQSEIGRQEGYDDEQLLPVLLITNDKLKALRAYYERLTQEEQNNSEDNQNESEISQEEAADSENENVDASAENEEAKIDARDFILEPYRVQKAHVFSLTEEADRTETALSLIRIREQRIRNTVSDYRELQEKLNASDPKTILILKDDTICKEQALLCRTLHDANIIDVTNKGKEAVSGLSFEAEVRSKQIKTIICCGGKAAQEATAYLKRVRSEDKHGKQCEYVYIPSISSLMESSGTEFDTFYIIPGSLMNEDRVRIQNTIMGQSMKMYLTRKNCYDATYSVNQLLKRILSKEKLSEAYLIKALLISNYCDRLIGENIIDKCAAMVSEHLHCCRGTALLYVSAAAAVFGREHITKVAWKNDRQALADAISELLIRFKIKDMQRLSAFVRSALGADRKYPKGNEVSAYLKARSLIFTPEEEKDTLFRWKHGFSEDMFAYFEKPLLKKNLEKMIIALSYFGRDQKAAESAEAARLDKKVLKALEWNMEHIKALGIKACYLLTDQYQNELNEYIETHSDSISYPVEVLEMHGGAVMWENFITAVGEEINKEKLIFIRGDIVLQNNVLAKFAARKVSSYIRTYSNENLKDIMEPTVFADFAESEINRQAGYDDEQLLPVMVIANKELKALQAYYAMQSADGQQQNSGEIQTEGNTQETKDGSESRTEGTDALTELEEAKVKAFGFILSPYRVQKAHVFSWIEEEDRAETATELMKIREQQIHNSTADYRELEQKLYESDPKTILLIKDDTINNEQKLLCRTLHDANIVDISQLEKNGIIDPKLTDGVIRGEIRKIVCCGGKKAQDTAARLHELQPKGENGEQCECIYMPTAGSLMDCTGTAYDTFYIIPGSFTNEDRVRIQNTIMGQSMKMYLTRKNCYDATYSVNQILKHVLSREKLSESYLARSLMISNYCDRLIGKNTIDICAEAIGKRLHSCMGTAMLYVTAAAVAYGRDNTEKIAWENGRRAFADAVSELLIRFKIKDTQRLTAFALAALAADRIYPKGNLVTAWLKSQEFFISDDFQENTLFRWIPNTSSDMFALLDEQNLISDRLENADEEEKEYLFSGDYIKCRAIGNKMYSFALCTKAENIQLQLLDFVFDLCDKNGLHPYLAGWKTKNILIQERERKREAILKDVEGSNEYYIDPAPLRAVFTEQMLDKSSDLNREKQEERFLALEETKMQNSLLWDGCFRLMLAPKEIEKLADLIKAAGEQDSECCFCADRCVNVTPCVFADLFVYNNHCEQLTKWNVKAKTKNKYIGIVIDRMLPYGEMSDSLRDSFKNVLMFNRALMTKQEYDFKVDERKLPISEIKLQKKSQEELCTDIRHALQRYTKNAAASSDDIFFWLDVGRKCRHVFSKRDITLIKVGNHLRPAAFCIPHDTALSNILSGTCSVTLDRKYQISEPDIKKTPQLTVSQRLKKKYMFAISYRLKRYTKPLKRVKNAVVRRVKKAKKLTARYIKQAKNATRRFIKKAKSSAKKTYKKIRTESKIILRRQKTRIKAMLFSAGLITSPFYKELKSYRNKYKGQRCFLIGNGPSLRSEDLDMLRNEITFGCNFIHKIYNQTEWRPTFHFISDSSTVRTSCWDILEHADLKKTTFVIRDFAYDAMPLKPEHALVAPSVSADYYKVSRNFLKYHYVSHATVMCMMLEAAMYMGFSEIYLLGVDASTSSDKGGNFTANYFTPEQRAKLDAIKRKAIKNYNVIERRKEIAERQRMVYNMVYERSKQLKIHIYNATRGGELEVFPRVDFDKVIGEDNKND